MSRLYLEEEENPIVDLIWNFDLNDERISDWFNRFIRLCVICSQKCMNL